MEENVRMLVMGAKSQQPCSQVKTNDGGRQHLHAWDGRKSTAAMQPSEYKS